MLNSNKIEKVRKYKSYTQASFAEKLGMKLGGYKNNLKTGNFRAEHIEKISELLGISIHNLFSSYVNKEHDETIVEEERAEYVTKIKELKKEIKVLEDRLKDKDEIIKLLKSSK